MPRPLIRSLYGLHSKGGPDSHDKQARYDNGASLDLKMQPSQHESKVAALMNQLFLAVMEGIARKSWLSPMDILEMSGVCNLSSCMPVLEPCLAMPDMHRHAWQCKSHIWLSKQRFAGIPSLTHRLMDSCTSRACARCSFLVSWPHWASVRSLIAA